MTRTPYGPHMSAPAPATAAVSTPSRSNTCAVVVTYHPDAQFAERLLPLAGEVDRVIIVDNGSGEEERSMLRSLVQPGKVELLANAENLGIATALNQGVRRAASLGYRWVLTMDQDSRARPGMIAGLAEALAACPFRDAVGLIAANFVDPAFGVLFARGGRGNAFIEQPTAITSGSLLSLAAFDRAGPFCDDFFIDFVDNEFALRLRSHGYRIIYSGRPLFDHAIGAPKRYRLLWMRPASSNHLPLRRYYITRNRLVTDWNYFIREPRWVMADLYRFLGEAFLMVLFEEKKGAKIAAVFRGAWDAMRGKMSKRR